MTTLEQLKRWTVYAAVLVALAIHWRLLWPYTRSPSYDFDAIYLYFPLARELLAHGFSFFATEQSLQAPPFSYIYPALLGPDVERLRTINGVLSGVTLVLTARTAQLAHSRSAGVIAAFVFALSPLLRPFLATPITEPPYLLLCAVWIWAFGEWLRSSAIVFLFVSAFAIVIASLTRATMFYWIVLLCGVSTYLALRGAPNVRTKARPFLRAHLIALLLPIALILKNLVIFGFPFYATGGGNALYLGNNPLTGGYEAPTLGLLFDVGSIARDQSHLTLEAERLLGGVARFMISQLNASFLLSLHVKKLAAFLFVTSAEPGAATLRSWRIALMLLSTLGVLAIRQKAIRWTLIGMALYQIAIHIPVLYTHRYSVGALDLWLTVLSGAGIASLLSWRRAKLAIGVIFVIVVGVQYGRWIYENSDPPQPNVFAAARLLMWEGRATDYFADEAGAPFEAQVVHRANPFDKASNYVLVLRVEVRADVETQSCSPLYIAFKPVGSHEYSNPVERKIHPRGPQTIQVGSEYLHLHSDGTLQLTMKCATPTTLLIDHMAVYAPLGSIDFRERFLGEKALFPNLER